MKQHRGVCRLCRRTGLLTASEPNGVCKPSCRPRKRTRTSAAHIIREHWDSFLYALGCVLIAAGCWQIFPPMGLIASGVAVLGFLIMAQRAATGSANGFVDTHHAEQAFEPGESQS